MTLSAATTVINGIIYIPVSYIAECFGWDLADEDGVYVLARGQKADLTLGRRVAENLE